MRCSHYFSRQLPVQASSQEENDPNKLQTNFRFLSFPPTIMTAHKAGPNGLVEKVQSKKHSKSVFNLGRRRTSSAAIETTRSLDLGWCHEAPTPSVVSLEEEEAVLMQLEGGLLGLPSGVVDSVAPKPSMFLSRLRRKTSDVTDASSAASSQEAVFQQYLSTDPVTHS